MALTPPAAPALDLAPPAELAPGVSFLGSLATVGPYSVAWSPDGKLLAYAYKATACSVIEVYRPTDGMLAARWALPPGIGQVTWAPDGQRIAFLRAAEPVAPEGGDLRYKDVGFVSLEDGDSHTLVEGMDFRARLDQWLDADTLLVWEGCGTGCRRIGTIDIATSDVADVYMRWEGPGGPLFGEELLFSADHRWLAATDIFLAFPRTVVVPAERWQDPKAMVPLAAGLNTGFTEPQFWSGHVLAFLAYPPGEPEDWGACVKRDLYVKDMETGELRLLGQGVTAASLDPTGSCVALMLDGPPRVHSGGVVSATVSTPYLALLSWPGWQLLGGQPAGSPLMFSAMLWSRDGRRLLYPAGRDSWAWMDREGGTGTLLASRYPEWAGWGADRVLALVVGQRIWLLRVP